MRRDGRQTLEMRGKELASAELTQFDGSCRYGQGMTSVMVALHGPVSAKAEDHLRCAVRVRVLHGASIPTAGGTDRLNVNERKRERCSEQDADELLSLIDSAISAVFVRERFPFCVLAIDVVVLHDDGSLAAVAINAVMQALLDAGLPCRTTMAAVSVAALRSVRGEPEELVYLLDPTQQEEGIMAPVTDGSQYTECAKSHLGGTGSAHICVALGTFVFANPSSGGGLLASHVHRGRNASFGGRGGDVQNLSLRETRDMIELAGRAVPAVLQFMRDCNA